MKIRSQRRSWLLCFGLGLLLVIADRVRHHGELAVVVYNDSDRMFDHVAVSVGGSSAEIPALRSRESAVLQFRPGNQAEEVRLGIDTDPVLRWSAPGLAAPGVSNITLRVNRTGAVTESIEESWGKRLSRILE